jgi:hypothetical protein
MHILKCLTGIWGSAGSVVKYMPEHNHIGLNNAIRDGKMLRHTVCEVCGSSLNVEAYHDDYTKPLIVRWLCKKHHWEADCVRREQEAVSFNFGHNVA